MFQFNKKATLFDVIIGESSVIRGDIESEGSIRIDGHLDGSVTSRTGEVIISANAVVNGNIYAQLADIFGKCTGNIIVQTHVTLHSEASLRGDVRAESMNAEKGAEFTGHCTILNKTAPERAERVSRPARTESIKNEKPERFDAEAAKSDHPNPKWAETTRRPALRNKSEQSEKTSVNS